MGLSISPMSADFDSEIAPIHSVDQINYNTPHGDQAHLAHHHEPHHIQVDEPVPQTNPGKVEQSFLVGVFILCIILTVITLWYVNFPPRPSLLY